jgi:hypothetical protein
VVRLPVFLQNCFFGEGGAYELNLPTTVPTIAVIVIHSHIAIARP